jgi:hypothetical protein
MSKASYNNQARVHNGYHYPRSLLTGLRSRKNLPVFVREFEDSIVSDFTKLYAVPKQLSKVTSRQFKHFCSQIEAPLAPAAPKFTGLFSRQLIDEVFEVSEFAFDAVKLRALVTNRMAEAGVEVVLDFEVQKVRSSGSSLMVHSREDAVAGCFWVGKLRRLKEDRRRRLGFDLVSVWPMGWMLLRFLFRRTGCCRAIEFERLRKGFPLERILVSRQARLGEVNVWFARGMNVL